MYSEDTGILIDPRVCYCVMPIDSCAVVGLKVVPLVILADVVREE